MVHQVKQLAISLLARESDRGGTDASLGKVHIMLHGECRCMRTSPIEDFFRLVWKYVIKTSRPYGSTSQSLPYFPWSFNNVDLLTSRI